MQAAKSFFYEAVKAVFGDFSQSVQRHPLFFSAAVLAMATGSSEAAEIGLGLCPYQGDCHVDWQRVPSPHRFFLNL